MSSLSYPSDPQDPSDLLKNVHFSSQTSDPIPETLTASDLLSAPYDPAKLHPMASLGDQLDYLVLDDDKTSDLPGSGTAIPSRGWSDDLCYGTGTMYLGGMSSMLLAINTVFHYSFPHPMGHVQISPYQPSYCLCADHMFRPPIGLALGGAWGFREGAGRSLAVSNARLRINSILNSVTRRGTFLGNSAGVLGMIHPHNNLFVLHSAPALYSFGIQWN